jgi:predicted regulator of Ras-like GTPase activity (Roadblock/LC7/MglB family)
MENLLNNLLENYMEIVDGILAAAIVDKNGLIIQQVFHFSLT